MRAQVEIPDDASPSASPLWEYAAYRADLARMVRRVRIFVLCVLAVYAVGSTSGLWPSQSPLGWVGVAAAALTFVALNVQSCRWDAAGVHDDARQFVEVVADSIAMLVLFGLTTEVIRYQPFPLGVFLAIMEASLRLSQRRAIAVTAVLAASVTALRLVVPIRWPLVLQPWESARVVPMMFASLLLAWVVTWMAARLDSMRQDALQNAESLATASNIVRLQADDLAATVTSLERYTAVVAHDLRSPIATAGMIAGLVVDPALPESDRADLVVRLRRVLDRATGLIDRLHENARSTTSELHLSQVDLDEVLDQVLDDHDESIAESGALVHRAAPLPTVTGDEVMLRQMLANLVANALRHGRPAHGPLELTFDAALTVHDVLVTLRDNGPGVAPEHRADLFTVGTGTRTIGAEGIGLGLATCANVARRHGGTLWVDDAPGGGALFGFALPRADASMPARRPAAAVS